MFKRSPKVRTTQPDLSTVFREGQRIAYAGGTLMVASFSTYCVSHSWSGGQSIVMMQCVYNDNSGVIQQIEFGPTDFRALMHENQSRPPEPASAPPPTTQYPEAT